MRIDPDAGEVTFLKHIRITLTKSDGQADIYFNDFACKNSLDRIAGLADGSEIVTASR